MMKNILLILCDQLSATALSAYGNADSRTPHIDELAKNSAILEHAYTPCPLCQPARASFWSSRYPHQTRIRTNEKQLGFPALSESIPTLGDCFSSSGYECVHFGKTHDYGSLRGFTVVPDLEIKTRRTHPAIKFDYETFKDIDTTQKVTAYLRSKEAENTAARPKQNARTPFLAVADLQNPHNICAYIGEKEHSDPDFDTRGLPLPPLPENFDCSDLPNRPPFIQYLCCANRRQRQVSHWDDTDFRRYLYAYYYYLEMADRQVGEILSALAGSGHAEDTLVVFFADHGEGMGAHHLVTKYGTFYEETNRVPFFFSGPGITPGRIDGVASLLDLMPTLLEYAGIKAPEGMEGHSLMDCLNPALVSDTGAAASLAFHASSISPRTTGQSYAAGEWHDEFSGYTVPGRMICDQQYKYICYREPDSEELYSMESDRLEQKNLAGQAKYRPVLDHYRRRLAEHVTRTKDDFFTLTANYKPFYRCHPLGYSFHEGPSAVEIYASGGIS